MFFDDHEPKHFHATYSGQDGVFDLEGNLINGQMKKTAQKLIKEWAKLHNKELEENWDRSKKMEELNKINPLT